MKQAVLYRMVTPEHLCPWGVKAKFHLEQADYTVEDHHLPSMDANKSFKNEHHVDETPQVYMGGRANRGLCGLNAIFGQAG